MKTKIPINLEECIASFEKNGDKKELEQWAKVNEDEATSSIHFTLGMNTRNNWNLWKKNKLTKYFNKLGIYHADDMSGIIFTSLHRKLNHKDINLEEQVKMYKDYWTVLGYKDGNPCNNSKENYTPNNNIIIIDNKTRKIL